MKKFLISIFTGLLIISGTGYGQGAIKQAGFRTGYRGGLFFQLTSGAGNAEIGYNAMAGFNENGVQFTGLRIVYETNLPSISPDLFFSWGYGGHFGFIVTDHLSYFGERYDFENDRFCPLLGADGWAAIDYRFREMPIVVSLNVKPYVEMTVPAFVKVMPVDIGIAVSYVF